MATIWKGAIAFGMVNIPIKLVSAVRSHDLSFKLLHPEGEGDKQTLCPVGLKRICKKDEEVIPWREVVKGYEVGKDQYVVLTGEDFEEAASATSKAIEIEDFTDGGQIDPRYYEKPYILIPQEGGEKAYALLREAMRSSERVGIGRFTLRNRQHIASIRPEGGMLVLDLMRYADEVLSGSEYRFPEADVFKKQELQMAEQLIENLSTDFEPDRYEDEYKKNLLAIIEAKKKGETVELSSTAEPEMTGVIDLMDRLKQSLAATGEKKAAKKPAEKSASKGKSKRSAA